MRGRAAIRRNMPTGRGTNICSSPQGAHVSRSWRSASEKAGQIVVLLRPHAQPPACEIARVWPKPLVLRSCWVHSDEHVERI
jgi:hypothetical protein